jgi:hypothetical protein
MAVVSLVDGLRFSGLRLTFKLVPSKYMETSMSSHRMIKVKNLNLCNMGEIYLQEW